RGRAWAALPSVVGLLWVVRRRPTGSDGRRGVPVRLRDDSWFGRVSFPCGLESAALFSGPAGTGLRIDSSRSRQCWTLANVPLLWNDAGPVVGSGHGGTDRLE